MFNDLVQNVCDVLHMVWYLESQTNVEYVANQFHGHLLMLHKTYAITGVVFMVIKDGWEINVPFIKDQCIGVALELIKKLARCFPTHDLINATKIIYWENVGKQLMRRSLLLGIRQF
jgi:hypothetical protein